MPKGWVHFYKGYQLARAWRSKTFLYGNEVLPAHVTNYNMAEKFIDTYLEPKMIELGLCKKRDEQPMFNFDVHSTFPPEHRQAIRDEIEKHWFYYKEDEQLDKVED